MLDTISQMIREHRKQLGLTIEELGREIWQFLQLYFSD